MTDIELADFLSESLEIWTLEPLVFFDEVLDFRADDWQARVAQDLVTNRKVAIKSGQGVGKTAFEAAVFLWFLTCHEKIGRAHV